jgi:hypothetical protein
MLFKSIRPAAIKRVVYTLLLIFIFATHLPAQGIPKGAVGQKKPSAENSSEGVQMPQGLTPEQVDAHLATMDDVQVRQVLAQKLKQEAAQNAPSKDAAPAAEERGRRLAIFYRFADAAAAVLKRIGSVFSSAAERSDHWDETINRLSGGKGSSHLLGTLFGTALIIVCGLILKMLFVRSTRGIRKQLLQTMHLGKLEFFGRVLSRMLLNATGVAIYVLTTFILFVLVYEKGEPGYLIAAVYLIVSYYILLFAFAATVIFAPAAPGLRLFPLQDIDAVFLHRRYYPVAIRDQQRALSADIQLCRGYRHFGPDDHDLAKPPAGGTGSGWRQPRKGSNGNITWATTCPQLALPSHPLCFFYGHLLDQ